MHLNNTPRYYTYSRYLWYVPSDEEVAQEVVQTKA